MSCSGAIVSATSLLEFGVPPAGTANSDSLEINILLNINAGIIGTVNGEVNIVGTSAPVGTLIGSTPSLTEDRILAIEHDHRPLGAHT